MSLTVLSQLGVEPAPVAPEGPIGAPRSLDIGQLMFLEMLEASIGSLGPAAVTRMLVQVAVRTAQRFAPLDFASLEHYVDAIEDLQNPIARVEGRAEHLGGGLFGLRRCPFANAYRSYRGLFEPTVPRLSALQEAFNRATELTRQHAIGHGSAVCPFCCAHQPLRALVAQRLTIGGRPLTLRQLACRSITGHRGFADEFIRAAHRSRDEVNAVLDEYVCCYALEVGPEPAVRPAAATDA